MKKLAALLTTLTTLAACQTGPTVRIIKPSNHAVAVSALQRVNAKVYECWPSDKDLKVYGVIPELDSSGTPRILVIPKGKPQSLPKLVITASGKGVTSFGPLAQSALAPRINADLNRWAAGGASCSA